MAEAWRKCKPEMFRRVNFALSVATVRLISSFVYRPSLEEPRGGRVYHVEDVVSGRRDFVGEEYLERIEQKVNQCR